MVAKKRSYKLKAWCFEFPEVKDAIVQVWAAHEFCLAQEGLQLNLGTTRRVCKTWCLDYKAHHGFQWDQFDRELTQAQSGDSFV